MTTPPPDPYFAPMASAKPAPRPDVASRPRPLTAWLILFGLNLPIPAALATLVLLPAGWPGLVAGVVGWAGVGVLILSLIPALIAPARRGAWVVALLGPILIPHIIAGQTAVALASRILGIKDRLGFGMRPILGFKGGFLATVITGAELLAVSLLVGLPLQGLAAAWRRRTAADPPDGVGK